MLLCHSVIRGDFQPPCIRDQRGMSDKSAQNEQLATFSIRKLVARHACTRKLVHLRQRRRVPCETKKIAPPANPEPDLAETLLCVSASFECELCGRSARRTNSLRPSVRPSSENAQPGHARGGAGRRGRTQRHGSQTRSVQLAPLPCTCSPHGRCGVSYLVLLPSLFPRRCRTAVSSVRNSKLQRKGKRGTRRACNKRLAVI